MTIVVGISLRTAGKIYYFDPLHSAFHLGERVLVETTRGPEIGVIKQTNHEVSEGDIVTPLKSVIRRATAIDILRDTANRERETTALTVCKRFVDKLGLPMRLIDAQYTLDCSHVLIHFLAENRVDFRELVRELAHELHARIELRQVGVRDEAKLLGGFGICGRHLCCSSFLSDFAPVAISMAKDQGLALNPQKISGSCGRLMCCLAFECNQYREEKADFPHINMLVMTPQGIGKVTKINVLARTIEVIIPELSSTLWFPMDELSAVKSEFEPCCAEMNHGLCPHGNTEIDSFFDESDLITTTSIEYVVQPTSGSTPILPVGTEESNLAEQHRPPRRRRHRPAGRPASIPGTKADSAIRAVPKGANDDMKPHHLHNSNLPQSHTPSSEDSTASVGVNTDAQTSARGNRTPSAHYRPRRRRPNNGNQTGNS